MVSRREQDPYVPIAGMAGAVAKILTQVFFLGRKKIKTHKMSKILIRKTTKITV